MASRFWLGGYIIWSHFSSSFFFQRVTVNSPSQHLALLRQLQVFIPDLESGNPVFNSQYLLFSLLFWFWVTSQSHILRELQHYCSFQKKWHPDSPAQVLLSYLILYPSGHAHTRTPFTKLQLCEHPPLFCTQGSTSAKAKEKNQY